tara:strand:- start:188429 stop:190888 length:2460 start_codon:yes stop_codon:yes gene_type:complete
MNGHDDEGNKEDGGVWTSYSDLFTTVAVIFLVMFVFALIKAGVSKMETVVAKKRHEQELKGQISQKSKTETNQKLKKVESSISEIADYEEIIDQKMIQMNAFVKDLKKNKKVLKDLIQEHQKKDTLLQTASASIKKYEKELKEQVVQNTELEKGLEKKKKELESLTKTKQTLQANLGELKEAYNKQKQKIFKQDDQRKSLEKELKEKKLQLQASLKEGLERKSQIKKLNKQKLEIQNELTSTNKSFEQFKKEKALEVSNHLKEISMQKAEVSKLKDKVASAKVKIEEEKIRIKNIRMEFEKKKLALLDAKNKIESQYSEKQALEKKLAGVQALNKKLDKTLKEKLQEKAELAKQKTELEEELKIVSTRANAAEMKSKELEAELASTTTTLNKMINERDELAKQNVHLKKVEADHVALKKVHEALKGKSKSLENDLASKSLALSNTEAAKDRLQSQNHQLNFELAKNLSKIRSQESKIGKLSKEKNLLEKDNESLRRDIASIGESRAEVLRENLGLKDQIEGLKKKAPISKAELAKLKKEKQRVLKKLEVVKKDLGYEKEKLAKVEAKFLEKLNQMEEEKKGHHACVENKIKLVAKNKSLKESLNNFADKVASVKGKLRSTIAKELADAFEKANLNVKVDKKTGNVVLLMDKNFRFKKNSFYLNKAARATLKKIIPIYSKALFGNEKVKDKIGSFNVVGHASPSFRGKYVEPDKQNSEAYSYNMRLSAQRASSIANYIFSKSIGAYPFKGELQAFAKSIGQGYIKPVMTKPKIGRGLASVKEGQCGPYDCYASQRVELSFTLKDDVASINKLVEMAKGIN